MELERGAEMRNLHNKEWHVAPCFDDPRDCRWLGPWTRMVVDRNEDNDPWEAPGNMELLVQMEVGCLDKATVA